MALTVKHINADASFLLSFEPLPSAATTPTTEPRPKPVHILIDPWITGPSTVFHSRFSITTNKEAACVSSLAELPEPDLVIISQHKTDHCNPATLRQLPATGTKTLILAEPQAARVIRSWKYFDPTKVRTIQRFEDPALSGRDTVTRIPVPPTVPGGEPGEITVAFIPQRRDISGLHAAVGITYRPPRVPAPSFVPIPAPMMISTAKRAPAQQSAAPIDLPTPPETPRSSHSVPHLSTLFVSHASSQQGDRPQAPRRPAPPIPVEVRPNMGPLTPTSPGLSLRSVRSFSSLARKTSTATNSSLSTPPPQRALSVLFSPHGISLPSLRPYATAHLASPSVAALPLTALLHCFDAVSNPWWFGGNILLGAPAGQQTAAALGARAWISCHDGDKVVKGLGTKLLRTERYEKDRVVQAVGPSFEADSRPGGPATVKRTDVLALESGEEVVLTSEGVWNIEAGLAEGIVGHEKARKSKPSVPAGARGLPQSRVGTQLDDIREMSASCSRTLA